jgi:hypothetical protein
MGGNAAWKEQQQLRRYCLEQDLWEVDLSRSSYDWRQLLKSMPPAKSCGLVGPGVIKFSFRLLRNVVDHNYIKRDSGERHVFEIWCADDVRWHLHFHKNGSMDNPVYVPLTLASAAQPAHMASVAQPAVELHPLWTFDDIMSATAHASPAVGKNEVSMALDVFLNFYCRTGAGAVGAVDITSQEAFPWARWLRNVVTNREIIGDGIVRVFAFRETTDSAAEIVFCHPNDTCTHVQPRKRIQCERKGCWRSEPVFMHAIVASESWMRLRVQPDADSTAPSSQGTSSLMVRTMQC